jgi:hypothetical protein
VSDQEARPRKSATGLCSVARVLLDRAHKVDSLQKKRKLARQAFKLVQEAIVLQRWAKKRKHASVRTSPPRVLGKSISGPKVARLRGQATVKPTA